MAINNRDYSVKVLQKLKRTIPPIEKCLEKVSDVANHSWEGLLFELRDIHPNSDFYFKALKIYTEKVEQLTYDLELIPSHSGENKSQIFNIAIEHVPEYINSWANNLRFYNDTQITSANKFEKFYEEEFAEFVILDDDAYIHPHTSQIQYKIAGLLDEVIKNLDKSDPQQADAIKFAEEIRDTLPTTNKAKVAASISKLFGKIRIIGGKGLMAFKKLLIEELPKILLREGVHELLSNIR
ncbi:hypothetical protein D3C87_719940 [compost metagenome]